MDSEGGDECDLLGCVLLRFSQGVETVQIGAALWACRLDASEGRGWDAGVEETAYSWRSCAHPTTVGCALGSKSSNVRD